jgi:hypothetical protein
MSYIPKISKIRIPGDKRRKMLHTIRLIGRAIQRGSRYLPIRNHAAALATMAGPKDYIGQVRNVYKDMVSRWRYVNDPFGSELLTYGPRALATLVMGLDGRGVGRGRGAGDCDCVAGATGASLMAIGRPIRLAVTAPPYYPPGDTFTHIFCQANVPGIGWVTVDPVMHPKKGLGKTPKHSRIAYFGLNGQLQGYAGNVQW